MKKYLSLAVIVLVLVGGAWYSEKTFLASSQTENVSATAATASAKAAFTSTSTTPDGYEVNVAPAPARSSAAPATEITSNAPASSGAPTLGTATLSVGGVSTYTVQVSANETIEQAMQRLESSSSFIYTYKEYAGLGAMVESINGKASDGGSYWFLYVNGENSNTGISSTMLHPGDTVEWRYEQDE